MEDVIRKDGQRKEIKKWGKIKTDNWVIEEDLENDNLVDQQSPINLVMGRRVNA